MASHVAPKPAPYSIALGAIAYSLAATFHKNLPVELIAAAPAAIVAAASAVERGLAEAVTAVDPSAAPKVEAKVDAPLNRLAAQAEAAAKDVQAGLATIGSSSSAA
jgi:hypothetical protein